MRLDLLHLARDICVLDFNATLALPVFERLRIPASNVSNVNGDTCYIYDDMTFVRTTGIRDAGSLAVPDEITEAVIVMYYITRSLPQVKDLIIRHLENKDVHI